MNSKAPHLPIKKYSTRQLREVCKWPCDGVLRFEVRGVRVPGYGRRVPYSVAYDAIIGETGSTMETLTHEGERRIRALNRLYLMFANEWVELQLWREREAVRHQAVTLPAGGIAP